MGHGMLKEERKIWKNVFSNWRYMVLTIVVAFIFFVLNGIILNVNNLSSISSGLDFLGSIKIFSTILLGFGSRVAVHTFISTILISLLIGVLFSLITYKIRSTHAKSSNWGILPSVGTFVAAFAPGCAACGIGLVAVLGLSGAAINFLPLKGFEISLISLLILSIAIFKISGNLARPPACKVDLKKIKKMGKNQND